MRSQLTRYAGTWSGASAPLHVPLLRISNYRSFVARLALIHLALLMAAGCSSRIPTFPTHGKVVYKDSQKPVTAGVTIWFESTTPPYHRASSEVDAEGKFNLNFVREGDGAMEGEHRIRFAPPPIASGTTEQALAKIMHPRYLEFKTSNLKQTITKGANELVIEVEKAP